MTITLTDEQREVLLLVIDDAIDELDMDNLNEIALLNEIKDQLRSK